MSLAAWTERIRRAREESTKWFNIAWRRSGRALWIIAVTTIVMILPLVMEIERESDVIELEKIQIKEYKAQGYTDQQLQQMGLTNTPEPSVGLNAPLPLPK